MSEKRRKGPLRCGVCGRFLGWAEFEAGKALVSQYTPDSHYTAETFEYAHQACLNKEKP